jgi:plasmid stability protein
MAQLLIRNLPDEDVATLKEQARERNSSLEAEARAVLHEAAERRRRQSREFWDWADEMRKRLQGRPHTEAAVLRHRGRALPGG